MDPGGHTEGPGLILKSNIETSFTKLARYVVWLMRAAGTPRPKIRSPTPSTCTEGCPACRIAPTLALDRRDETSTIPPDMVTATMGLDAGTAAMIAATSACWPGKMSMLSRSWPSVSTVRSVPRDRTTTSAAWAAAIAAAKPEVSLDITVAKPATPTVAGTQLAIASVRVW